MNKTTLNSERKEEIPVIQGGKEIITKDDSDSGLENNSDSGFSCDEEPSRSSSDFNDLSGNKIGGARVRPEGRKKKQKDLEPPAISAEISNIESEIYNQNVGKCPWKSKRNVFLFRESNVISDEPTTSKSTSIAIDTENDEIKLEDLPEFFRELLKGQAEAADFDVSFETRPEWLDEEKFKRGQKFATENLFSINFAEMLSLIMLFGIKSALRPLIFTGKSDTPYKAFRRYLSTLTKLKSWYEGDVWCEGESTAKKNLKVVNSMHRHVFNTLTESSPDDLDRKTTLGDPQTTALWCPMKDIIAEDFRSSCPVARFSSQETEGKVWVNQLDMSITQFAFVGLVVTYPTYFGLHYATEVEFDAFLHMWRGLGYLLGIKDKYNFCNADLSVVQQRSRDFIEMVVKPSLRDVTEDWEHMCRCMVRGIAFYVPFVEFESALLYLCYTIDIDMPRLKKSITFNHYLRFLTHKFVNLLQRIPGVLPAMNRRLNMFIKTAQEASPNLLAKWEATEFPYTNQPGKKQIQS